MLSAYSQVVFVQCTCGTYVLIKKIKQNYKVTISHTKISFGSLGFILNVILFYNSEKFDI